jgi:hypothetical protein
MFKTIIHWNFFPFAFILMVCSPVLNAQVVNSAKLVFSNGVQAVISGGTNGDFTNSGTGQVVSSGTGGLLKIEGDLTNNGSDLNFNNVKVMFSGSNDISINGSGNLTFNKVEVAKVPTLSGSKAPGKVITLNRAINVNDSLKMTVGQIDLRNSILDLGTTGLIINETNDNRIKATDGATDGAGTGYIVALRTLSSGSNPNVAGMGIDVNTSTYIGAKTLKRGHQIQMGTGSFTSNQSVMRYYDLPGFGDVNAANYITFHYFENELNGHSESELVAYQDIQNSSTHTWAPLNSAPTTASDYCSLFSGSYGYYMFSTPAGSYDFSSGRFTLGSLSKPLPVELVDFHLTCNGTSYSIDWSTASEVNNYYFTLERSVDGVSYQTVTLVNGAGNSNQMLNYHVEDLFSSDDAVYYRLTQTDYDGKTERFAPKSIRCGSSDANVADVQIFTPNHRDIVVNFQAPVTQQYLLTVYDNIGQLLFFQNETSAIGENHLVINNLNVATSLFLVNLQMKGIEKTVKIHLQ